MISEKMRLLKAERGMIIHKDSMVTVTDITNVKVETVLAGVQHQDGKVILVSA